MISDKKHRSTPRGSSLVETLTAIAIAGAIFSITATLFYTLLTGRGDGRQALEQRVSDVRLADDFRRDVHASGTAQATNLADVPRLVLTQADGRTVEYHYEQGQLIRHEKLADKPLRQETYRLTGVSGVRFEVEQAAEASLVRLAWIEISAPSGMASAGTSAERPHELLALVGRDVVAPIQVASAPESTTEPTGETP